MTTRSGLAIGVLGLVVVASVAGVATFGAEPATATMECQFPLTVTDATGTTVTIEEEPQRVLVLGPSATQTIWEIGLQDRVVGIDAFSTYLDGAGDIPVVSQGISRVDYEAALEQDPDLILIDGNSYADSVATEFRQSNVTVVKLESVASLDGVVNKTMHVGRLLGACSAAHERATALEERIATVREAVEGEPTPTLFYDLGSAQGSARYSVGPNTFIGDIITKAGATNIVSLGNFTSPYPQVSNEFILRQDPKWLLVTYTPGSQYGPSTPEEARAAVANSSVLSETQAYEMGNVIVVNANNLNQPAPRVVEALEAIAKAIHPEAYAAANTTTTTTTETTTTTTTETTTTTSGNGGPGFGPVAALLSVLVGALLATRR